MKDELIHLASSLALLILGGFGTVFWFYYRRDSNHDDEDAKEAKRVLEAYGGKIDSHARQIRDTRAAVACCETALEIQHYPYVD